MEFAIDPPLCTKCHCLAARKRARALTRLYESKLRPHGLRATQFSILVALAVAGPKPLGALASALGLERTTLTRSAGLLQRNGWLKEESSGDGRERLLQLTTPGRRKLEQSYAAWKAAQREAEKQIRGSAEPPGNR